jgi:hypothetical protein
MSGIPEASPSVRRDRSVVARRKGRRTRNDRERRIMNLLNAGVPVAEIAAEQGV